eukprot:scaffold7553_cov57-Phaeocystis_antarctica.AAC.2
MQQPAFPRPSHQLRQTDLSLAPLESAAMAAGSLFWQPAPQSPKPQFFCCVKPGQPARAGARSRASRSHTNIRRPGGRRHGVAEASTVAAAARLPASGVKSSPTPRVLAAAARRPPRSASARSVSGVPNASTACRAPQGGWACAREGPRTPSRRDGTQRACITRKPTPAVPASRELRRPSIAKFWVFS